MSSYGNFSDSSKQIQSLLVKMLENDRLTKLIYYTSSTPLSSPSLVNPYDLLNTRMYTQTYLPPTDEQVVYVCAFYRNFRKDVGNPYSKHGQLEIAIIVHRDLWQCDGFIRPYEIAHEIDNIVNRNSATESLSNDWFVGMDYVPVNDLYNSIILRYSNWNL